MGKKILDVIDHIKLSTSLDHIKLSTSLDVLFFFLLIKLP